MRITVKYFLNIERIMGKKFDEFICENGKNLKEVLEENIDSDKMEEIEEMSIIVTKNGKNCNNINVSIEENDVFCLLPAIYGG